MSANMMNPEALLKQFILLRDRYKRILSEHLGSEDPDKDQQLVIDGNHYTELLKILRAELQSFEKRFVLCELAIARSDLKPEFQPQIKEAMAEISIMHAGLDHTEAEIENKAKKLAELLYACLVIGVQSISADNSVTFLSKMRVFPRVTSQGHLDPISAINLRKMIDTTMQHLGNMYLATIADMRNKSAAVQDINAVRQQAIVVYNALIKFSANSPTKTVATEAAGIVKAEGIVKQLTADIAHDEPPTHAHIRPTLPGSSASKL